ncbi:thiaminase II/PqqC family protein [Haladaptatus caseinilyticus]
MAESVWDAILEHPMIEKFREGTFNEELFRNWIRQDCVYLGVEGGDK